MRKKISICAICMLLLMLCFVPATEGTKQVTIPIAMATDNKYADFTLVSILSAIKNARKETKLKFYLLVTDDFSEDNKRKTLKIVNKFKNCDINIINMGGCYKNAPKGTWGTAMYYRLKLSSILKGESKCIYLDGDTLVLNDLTNMYNLNVKDYYVAGVADYLRFSKSYGKKIGIKEMNSFICSGVLLWNLDKIREDKIENEFEKFLQEISAGKRQVRLPDQDLINLVCFGKILVLPQKYGALYNVIKQKRYKNSFAIFGSKDEWLEAKQNPIIVHYAGPFKPWGINSKTHYDYIWEKYYSYLKVLLAQ